MESTLKIAIQKALSKNLPLILEDAIQSLEKHHLQLKRSKNPRSQYDCPPEDDDFGEASKAAIVPKTPRRTGPIKEPQCHQDAATIPYFDCPPESWEDIGFEEEATPPEADVVSGSDYVSRFENTTSSNPITEDEYSDDDYLSIYDQLD